MAEIKQDGYISIRKMIVENWDKFALTDDGGEEVFNTKLNSDNWTHVKQEESVCIGKDMRGAPVKEDKSYESNQTLEIEVVITGADVDSLPVTVNKSTLRENYSYHEDAQIEDKNGDEGCHQDTRLVSEESFDNFTFENEEDELTIKHKINVPKI